jgi:excinuclease UvrABC nuclease subunit
MVPHTLSLMGVRAYAPVASGVYGISNASEWIYIGESDNIQVALQHYLQDVDTSIVEPQPTGFVFEVCHPSKRVARQDRLVCEYEPIGNRAGTRERGTR